MMKPIASTILLLGHVLLLTNCNQQRYAYAANKINTPTLRQKGESRLDASLSVGNARSDLNQNGRNLGFDVQGAYAVSNHLGLMASLYNRWEKDVYNNDAYYRGPFSSSVVNYKRSTGEIGFGYFGRPEKTTVFSIYAGLGTGSMRIKDAGKIDTLSYTRHLSARLWRYFLQPGFSYVSPNRFSLDLSVRISWIDYTQSETTYTTFEQQDLRLQNLDGLSVLTIPEPSLTFQIPLTKPSWLRAELNWSLAMRPFQVYTRRSSYSVGLTADPFLFFANKASKK